MQTSRISKRYPVLGLVLALVLFISFVMAQTQESPKKLALPAPEASKPAPDASKAAPAATQDPPKAVFKQTTHDFGTVKRGDPLSYTFIVKNEGKGPLNILSVNPG